MDINALVVDDSGIMRKMVMRSLTESKPARFAFTEAQDGLDALEKFDAKKTSIVFVDWNMPNMSGIDLVREIRSTVKHHVPIVMITTEGTMGKVGKVIGRSMDARRVRVADIMVRKVITCTRQTPDPQAQELMADNDIRHLPVVENGKPVAMISSRDILAHQLAQTQAIAGRQSKILNELEGKHPGISHLTRDQSGRIVI